jgi:ATP synthase I chain
VASPSIRRIERLNYAIGAIAIAVAALTQPRDIALGVTVGALLTCANFFVLRKLVTKWTREAAQGHGGNASMLMLPKMIGLMGAVALAIVFLPINVVAFTIGYSIFLISIAIEATHSTLRIPDDEPAAAPTKPTNSDEHNHG